MKLSIANSLVAILGGVKFMTAEDKALRESLLNNYLNLREFVRPAEDKRIEIQNKFNADWSGSDTKSAEFQRAFAALNESVGAIFNKDVEISIASVSLDDFMGVSGAKDLTLEQVAFLIEWGVLKK